MWVNFGRILCVVVFEQDWSYDAWVSSIAAVFSVTYDEHWFQMGQKPKKSLYDSRTLLCEHFILSTLHELIIGTLHQSGSSIISHFRPNKIFDTDLK